MSLVLFSFVVLRVYGFFCLIVYVVTEGYDGSQRALSAQSSWSMSQEESRAGETER